MLDKFPTYRAGDIQAARSLQQKIKEIAPDRRTEKDFSFLGFGGIGTLGKHQSTPKPTTRRLKNLSERPIPRAAINTVKKEVSLLPWDVRVKKHVTKKGKHDDQIRIARNIFDHPNQDDSFRTFLEQLLEDCLIGDFACFERQWTDDAEHPLWLWPVDGSTIQIYTGWDGNYGSPRYAQVPFGTTVDSEATIQLTDDELVYIIDNKRTSTPFGLSPLEVAAGYIDWLLQVQTFAARASTSVLPKKLMHLGEAVDNTYLQSFRSYWKYEVEGKGSQPIIAGSKNPQMLDLGPIDDEGLFLKWQEMLITVIAVSFDLNPQDLGMMFDSNRSNSVMQSAATKSGAIRPKAKLFAEVMTRNVLSYLGFDDLEFVFIEDEPSDMKTMATINTEYIQADLYTLGQMRQKIGEPLYGDMRDDMTHTEYIAFIAQKYGEVPEGLGSVKALPQKIGGGKGHGKSTGRPNGAIER